MKELIEKLCQDRVFYHFYQISQIPHGSGNEKALSDFIFGWDWKWNRISGTMYSSVSLLLPAMKMHLL